MTKPKKREYGGPSDEPLKSLIDLGWDEAYKRGEYTRQMAEARGRSIVLATLRERISDLSIDRPNTEEQYSYEGTEHGAGYYTAISDALAIIDALEKSDD